MKVQVIVKLKEEVLDSPGRALASRLVEMGYSEVRDVRIGKVIELDLEIGDEKTLTERIEKMNREILVNPVVEDVKFALVDE